MSTIFSDKISNLRYEERENKHPCFTPREQSKNSEILAPHTTQAWTAECIDVGIVTILGEVFSYCSVSHNFSQSFVSKAFLQSINKSYIYFAYSLIV